MGFQVQLDLQPGQNKARLRGNFQWKDRKDN